MKSRKEIKDEYKQTKSRMGVYAIRNIKSGKLFISSAMDLDRVWNAKKFQLELGGHPNRELQSDWNETGAAHFVFEILHELRPSDNSATNERSELKALEEMAIEEMRPFGERGYNTQRQISAVTS